MTAMDMPAHGSGVVEPAVHGGAPRGWLDFSANLNPTGVPREVAAAVATAAYETYGDLDASAAEARLAAEAGLDRLHIMLTAGAGEALRLCADAFLAPGSAALIAGPTYGEYARLTALRSAAVREIRTSERDLRPPTGPLLGALRSIQGSTEPGAVFVCDPNNPTGARLGHADLDAIVGALPPRWVFVLDQSFAPFAGPSPAARGLLRSGQVVLVRSLTKILAAPGVRVGYALGSPDLIGAMRRCREPWPLGSHAIAAATVASWELRAEVVRTIAAWRVRLAASLEALGMEVLPSEANFLLVRVGPAAERVVAGLAQIRVAVRFCASFSLPEHVRIAVRPPDEQDRLIDALERLRAEVGW